MRTYLACLFLVFLAFRPVCAASNDPFIVDATSQDRTSLAPGGADAQVVFLNYGITTLIFRVYDGALLDVTSRGR